MDESEKRRERLKAMRMEAAEVEVSNSQATTAGPDNLFKPLLDPFASPSAAEKTHAVSRFDFYTDPMSMFSGSKKRNCDSGQNSQGYFSPPIRSSSPMGRMSSSLSAGQRNPEMSPAPQQYQMNYCPEQSPAPHQYQMNYCPEQSPAPHQYQMNYSPEQRLYETPLPVPMYCSWRTPTSIPSPLLGHRGTPAGGTWNHSGSSPGYGRGRFHNSDYGRGSSPRTNSGRGNYHRYNNSPSPGSGRSCGRGRGFHAHASAQEQPELFYSKSMVEDPWRFLKPVVGSLVAIAKDELKTPNSLKSWLPKSLSMKKAKVLEDAAGFSSQSSLADCLSLAFQEAVEDAADA